MTNLDARLAAIQAQAADLQARLTAAQSDAAAAAKLTDATGSVPVKVG